MNERVRRTAGSGCNALVIVKFTDDTCLETGFPNPAKIKLNPIHRNEYVCMLDRDEVKPYLVQRSLDGHSLHDGDQAKKTGLWIWVL